MTTPNPGPLIAGIGIGGYRSLRETQHLAPLRKVTLVAGQNNAGKSNILRFIATALRESPPKLEWLDLPKPDGPQMRLEIAFPRPSDEELLERNPGIDAQSLQRAFDAPGFHPTNDPDLVWVAYLPPESSRAIRPSGVPWGFDPEYLNRVLGGVTNAARIFNQTSNLLAGQSGGASNDDLMRTLERIFPLNLPPVESIEAFRRIVKGETSEPEDLGRHLLNGQDLIERLAKLQSPSASSPQYRADRAKFEAINRFAQRVFDDSNVSIEIPADQQEITVHYAGQTLPLESMGTGIHQVIILAAAATTLDGTLICIEEPEVHLHPLLQRKLVRYLNAATTNQYIIATHSAHMLDYAEASVLHVTLTNDEGTLIRSATTPQAVADVCSDLGYKPSDLLQTNAVIWVEGPSDRIYLNFWLDHVCPDEFVEGIHYSVMFYGGGLLSHLSADDPAIQEFIALRQLNRHSAIIIDSDRTSGSKDINDTKKRVCREFEEAGMPGFAWVTDCRTIENYVPQSILTTAVTQVHNQSVYVAPSNKWQDPLQLRSRKSGHKAASPNKVRVAREVVELWARDGSLTRDLPTRIQQVVDFIRVANGDSTRPLPAGPGA